MGGFGAVWVTKMASTRLSVFNAGDALSAGSTHNAGLQPAAQGDDPEGKSFQVVNG